MALSKWTPCLNRPEANFFDGVQPQQEDYRCFELESRQLWVKWRLASDEVGRLQDEESSTISAVYIPDGMVVVAGGPPQISLKSIVQNLQVWGQRLFFKGGTTAGGTCPLSPNLLPFLCIQIDLQVPNNTGKVWSSSAHHEAILFAEWSCSLRIRYTETWQCTCCQSPHRQSPHRLACFCTDPRCLSSTCPLSYVMTPSPLRCWGANSSSLCWATLAQRQRCMNPLLG